jgi:hypothetical protein
MSLKKDWESGSGVARLHFATLANVNSDPKSYEAQCFAFSKTKVLNGQRLDAD